MLIEMYYDIVLLFLVILHSCMLHSSIYPALIAPKYNQTLDLLDLAA